MWTHSDHTPTDYRPAPSHWRTGHIPCVTCDIIVDVNTLWSYTHWLQACSVPLTYWTHSLCYLWYYCRCEHTLIMHTPTDYRPAPSHWRTEHIPCVTCDIIVDVNTLLSYTHWLQVCSVALTYRTHSSCYLWYYCRCEHTLVIHPLTTGLLCPIDVQHTFLVLPVILL